MANPKGSPQNLPTGPGIGRPKGTKNKVTINIKTAILESFDKIGAVNYLVEQAEKNPIAYMSLLGRIVPKEVNAAIRGDMIVTLTNDDEKL